MKEKEETIWEQLYRFIDSINDEIRSADPDNSVIDFWLFKIKNRVKIMKRYIDKLEKCNHKQKKLGYLAWFDWAEKQTKKGLKQKQCPVCRLWLFPGEF